MTWKKQLAVTAVVVLAAGCAGAAHSNRVAGHRDELVTRSVGAATTPEPEPATSADRLASPFTYDDGFTRFDPPPAAAQPTINSVDAVAALARTGLYADELAGKRPLSFLASYTSFGDATPGGDGSLIPAQPPVLVWVVRYEGVLDSSSLSSTKVSHDIVAIVDAANGTLDDVMSGLPDLQAAGIPRAHPSKASAAG